MNTEDGIFNTISAFTYVKEFHKFCVHLNSVSKWIKQWWLLNIKFSMEKVKLLKLYFLFDIF